MLATIVKTPADPLDNALDAALEMTFPASDPVAVFVPGEEDPVAVRATATPTKRRSLLLAGLGGAAMLAAPPPGRAASAGDPARAPPAHCGYSPASAHIMKYYETARV